MDNIDCNLVFTVILTLLNWIFCFCGGLFIGNWILKIMYPEDWPDWVDEDFNDNKKD